jgi:hypothetical protein
MAFQGISTNNTCNTLSDNDLNSKGFKSNDSLFKQQMILILYDTIKDYPK